MIPHLFSTRINLEHSYITHTAIATKVGDNCLYLSGYLFGGGEVGHRDRKWIGGGIGIGDRLDLGYDRLYL